MTRTGRGATGTGRPAVMPAGAYQPIEAVRETGGGRLVVDFHGDDGRRAEFDISRLPLPGWHPMLADAVAERTGPAGGLRTAAAAGTGWGAVVRLVRFLATLPQPPTVPEQLDSRHMAAFYQHRCASSLLTAQRDLAEARTLFILPAVRGRIPDAVLDHVQRRLPMPREGEAADVAAGAGAKRLTTGFSDGEFARLMAALRTDAAAIRDRIRHGEDLLARYLADAPDLGGSERELGRALWQMAQTGRVHPLPGRPLHAFAPQRRELAGHLFLTLADLPPLMMLAAALSERNGESIKELPVKHRVLEGKAVELVIVKRRRGTRRWFETVTWEIGSPGRELHHPGGFYLLLSELTARSRALRDSPLLWRVWRNGHGARQGRADDHVAPFDHSLRGTTILPSAWAATRPRPLLADPLVDGGVSAAGAPLQVSFNRIKTSMEVRRTKRMGGHLPSTAKSNTMPVLFRNYLSGDPVITAWAEEVLGEAFVDAEQAARAAHDRAAAVAGGGPRVVPGPTSTSALEERGLSPLAAVRAANGDLDVGWTACIEHERHPATGQPCQVTFLDCFHCGNCLVTRSHLPKLLGLLDALAERRKQLSEEDWWHRYGAAWAAIRHDILTEFTPAELDQARVEPAHDALLDLVENPWELP